MSGNGSGLRSERWFGSHDLAGLMHRAHLRSEGLSSASFDGRPIVGICNPWSELVNCNLHFRSMAVAIKRGVLQAGGIPLEFPVISLGETFMKPTTMLYRNLMAMDVEESIRSNPLDAVVLLGGCDKSIPAALMGAASVDVPAIMVTAGPTGPAVYRGREVSAGTDLWRATNDLRAGRMTAAEYAEFESALVPTSGHCPEMGTASTMSSIAEALGMALPGSAAIPAIHARRLAAAEDAGRRAVDLAHEGPRPSDILTADAFDNAITLLMALGGSTNAVIHLVALAGRLGIDLPLERFDTASRRTPLLVNVRPSGTHLFEHLFYSGGIPAILRELEPLIQGDVLTVTGRTLRENLAEPGPIPDPDVIRGLDHPFSGPGIITVLRGSLAPDGAVIKQSASSPELLRHCGRALVFEDVDDLASRIDDSDLDVDPDSVLVLRGVGPKGGPGMPEWGQLPIPEKLLRAGVTDMVRISDARMSGTAFGTVILHVAPEAAVGGPIGVVETGDPIALDVPAGRLDLDIPESELRRRLAAFTPPKPRYLRGYGALYLEHVLQADQGCDFDFLRRIPGAPFEREPLGFVQGPIGGW